MIRELWHSVGGTMKRTVTRVGIGLFTLVIAASALPARELSFDERVRAQEAIERVYHAHQLGSKESFAQAVPHTVVEQKVRNTFRQGAALETIWRTPITAEMLERELGRMAAGSRMPERLRELFEALGNDSFLIQECLARPALVDRLSRNFFASDQAIHADERREAEDLRAAIVAGTLEPTRAQTRRSIVARPDTAARWPGGVEPLAEDAEAFSFRVDSARSGLGSTQVAAYSVPKTSWDAWWAGVGPGLNGEGCTPVASESVRLPKLGAGDGARAAGAAPAAPTSCPLNDTWDNRRLGTPSEARSEHTAVWTGSLMIIWGGKDELSFPASGGRYDPATDTWSPTSLVNAPVPRTGHTAVWAGTRMVVFGGYENVTLGSDNYPDGAKYDPIADTWQPIASFAPRAYHTAVWTGSRMIVWGGAMPTAGALVLSGGVYDPDTDSWGLLNSIGAPPPRYRHTAVWTGTQMIVWGGLAVAGNEGSSVNSGGLYDPSTNSWASTNTVGAPTARAYHSAVWTGSRMVVWGGGSSGLNTGGRYDPATNSWTSTATIGAPTSRRAHTAAWTGSRMLVWGGFVIPSIVATNTGGGYDPGTDTWSAISVTNAPAARGAHSVVWTETRMIVWGGSPTTNAYVSTGGRYDPASDSWTPTANAAAPRARLGATGVWTGNQMIVWGGGVITNMQDLAAPGLSTGGRYDPTLDTWTPTRLAGGTLPTPSEAAPSPRIYHAAVWTGSRMIVWGGLSANTAPNTLLGTGGMYDPVRDNWVSTPPGPTARQFPTAAWTGSRMLIWGGYNGTDLATGSRFDPVALAWSPISTTGAPSGSGYVQAWTGSNLIVWSTAGGKRYDPVANAWTPMSAVDAPTGPVNFVGTWAGNRFVVWGASDTGSGIATGGGRYDPATDSWSPINPGGPLTDSAKAVSTGSRMLVWGGTGGASYDVAGDTWSAMTPSGAPSPRYLHAMVWTGNSLLVWGGGALNASAQFALNDGGRYIGAYPDDYDGDGQSGCDGDCDDTRADIYTGAPELCDGLDNNCDGIVPAGELDADLDGFTACGGGDCNDGNSAVHPGASELCDGLDDDCDGVLPPLEADADGDGVRLCGGDCNDSMASIYPGAAELCDGLDDNCDNAVPLIEADTDGDSVRVCGGDCNDGNAAIYPHAPEINDGLDNQCPGDQDYGVMDEITGVSGYFTTSDNVFSWPAQPGATSYEIARSPYGDFHAGCLHSITFSTSFSDSTLPPAGSSFYYLVRALTPYVGSWGQRTTPGDRVVCAGCVNSGDWCDDGNICTLTESCTGTTCGGGTAVSCDDGNRCTSDSCDPALGCVHVNNSLACNDGSVCTLIDHCSGGSCIPGIPLNCDDGNPCTNDSCDAVLGCIHVNNTNACDDGSVCTVGDTCGGGSCGGAALNCDDQNVCTTDSCNAISGCAHVDNTNACDDGSSCTTGDVCGGGVCVGTVTGAANHLVISQIQVAGATTDDEFVELYNPTLSSVSLVGLSLQYKNNQGASWAAQSLGLSGVSAVPARGWVLIARAAYDGAVASDETMVFSLSDAGAQVVLVSNTTPISSSCPTGATIIDKVSWGSGNCPETGPAAAPTANNSILRKPGGTCGNGTDTNSNLADFVTQTPSIPRNHLSPHQP